jgi:hypothetical protein
LLSLGSKKGDTSSNKSSSNANNRESTNISSSTSNFSSNTEQSLNPNERLVSTKLVPKHPRFIETPPTTPILSTTSLKAKTNNLIANVKEINVIMDNPNNNNNNNKNNTNKMRFSKKIEEDISLKELQPMKGLLHDELMKRINKDSKPLLNREVKKQVSKHLNTNSSSEDVKNFLRSKEFSNRFEKKRFLFNKYY